MAIGDITAQPATHKGRIEGAYEDTVFLSASSSGTLSELATDLSQEGDDLTVGTNTVYESSGTTRFGLQAPFSIEFKLNGNNTDTGRMFWRSDGSAIVDLQITGGGDTLALTVDTGPDSFSLSHTIGLAAGDADFYVGFSCEPNLDTAGSSDAVIWRLYSYAPGGPTYEQSVTSDVDAASITEQAFFLAQDSSGTNAWAGTCEAIRYSKAFHTFSEFIDAFVGLSDPGTPDGEVRTEVLTPVRGSNAGDDGQFVAIYPSIAEATRKADLRSLSPLHTYMNPIRGSSTWRDWSSGTLGEGNRTRPSSVDSGQDAHAFYLVRRPVDRSTTHVYVRMRFKTTSP